jgi:hypothetical protein
MRFAKSSGKPSAVDLTFAQVAPRVLQANVKSKTALETDICEWSFASDIRKSAPEKECEC